MPVLKQAGLERLHLLSVWTGGEEVGHSGCGVEGEGERKALVFSFELNYGRSTPPFFRAHHRVLRGPFLKGSQRCGF